MILRTLSTQELDAIIRQMNPQTKDVSAELIEQIGEKRMCDLR